MSNPNLLALRDKRFMHQVWALTKPYWGSNEKSVAWALLLSVVALNYLIVEVAVLYSNWNRDFFNLMQNEEWHNFWSMLATFVVIMGGYTIVDLAEEYLRRTLRIRWRRWLTHTYLSHWMGGQRLYRHQLAYPSSDNPDQRISQDIRDFCDQTLSMGLGLLRTITSLFSFTIILWNLSGSLEFEFAGSQWVVPGYMVWVAIVYSVIGTWLTHKIAKRLIPLNFEQEKSEADFRFHLMRVREHAESIALLRGEEAENLRTQQLFSKIWHNWQHLTGMKLKYGAFNSGYNEIARIFPYLVASPRLMSGALQLGDMMQTATGFYRVQEAFSWFVDSYESVADWKAVTDRLITFETQLETLPDQSDIGVSDNPTWSNFNLYTPSYKDLLKRQNGEITTSTVIKGKSGSGKTTLFRAFAGVWPYQTGQVSMPAQDDCMFVPQKPYLPNASLKQVLVYPKQEFDGTRQELVEALRLAELPEFVDELDSVSNWQQRLSGGELQKIMLAKCLVNKPKWLFLDESLSALDPESYAQMKQVIAEQLHATRVVEITHKEQATAQSELVLNSKIQAILNA